ncbi:MAG TPA: excinuclease ABC subunit UvrC [Planctomycetota bacterium]|nr:excinuclease ABC subunit UvrC [Planctomycetota bacterium]
MSEEPRWSLDGVPEKPGVYLFRDAAGDVLYVGKALSLRARLRSYRRPGGDGRLMIRFLVSDASAVETIVTRTEQEALLLEDALIKQHKPLHNIRLKDDKSFLMLRLDSGEEFPRFRFVRAHNPERSREGESSGRSRLFGPFANSRSLRRTLSDLHRVVPLRDCPDSVFANRSRPCMKHQIGLCAAPCVGLITREDYGELVARAERILSGDIAELEEELDGRMLAASSVQDYERAGQWRDRLAALRRTVERQGVRPADNVERDVLALVRSGRDALLHRLAFRGGRLQESRSHWFRSELPDDELWNNVITALYGAGKRAAPSEIVLDCEPADLELFQHLFGAGTRWIVPQSGERRRMLDLARENARSALDFHKHSKAVEEEALEALAELLDLPGSPEVIDCFDISTLQGRHTVASRVRMRGGHADKSGYRRFKLRTVVGQDDFASLKEVVGRSLRRGAQENELPDLIVIDGGAQQLASALEARAEAGLPEVRMIGLAKARSERRVKGRTKEASEERVYLPGVDEPLELGRNSPARLLLERIRDEAHRFAIAYHRKERGRIRSQLDSIDGLGPVKKRALLARFGSVAGIREESHESLAAVPGIGPRLASAILEGLARKDPPA